MQTSSSSKAMLAAVLLFAIGCGSGSGTSNNDESDGGAGTSNPTGTGGAGTTGAGGSGGETGGSAGSSSGSGGNSGATGGPDASSMCPATPPPVGTACSPTPSICTYGGGICCGGGYRCSANGKWEVILATCACIQPQDAGGQPDAMSVPDAPSSGGCAAAINLADCDARPGCHPVYVNQMVCGCAAPGCCIHYQRCAEGKNAKCTAPAGLGCAIQQPVCEGPYVVGYTNICYEGCVRATDCGA
jgi:hypothetical protein